MYNEDYGFPDYWTLKYLKDVKNVESYMEDDYEDDEERYVKLTLKIRIGKNTREVTHRFVYKEPEDYYMDYEDGLKTDEMLYLLYEVAKQEEDIEFYYDELKKSNIPFIPKKPELSDAYINFKEEDIEPRNEAFIKKIFTKLSKMNTLYLYSIENLFNALADVNWKWPEDVRSFENKKEYKQLESGEDINDRYESYEKFEDEYYN